jgi:hypothetical protein
MRSYTADKRNPDNRILVWSLLSTLGLLAGLAILMAGYGITTTFNVNNTLKHRGQNVTGEIERSFERGTSRGGPEYNLTYRYKLAAPPRRDYVRTETVPENVAAEFRAGQPVPVIYDESNPELARINIGDEYRRGHPNSYLIRLCFGMICATLVAFGVLLAIFRRYI